MSGKLLALSSIGLGQYFKLIDVNNLFCCICCGIIILSNCRSKFQEIRDNRLRMERGLSSQGVYLGLKADTHGKLIVTNITLIDIIMISRTANIFKRKYKP